MPNINLSSTGSNVTRRPYSSKDRWVIALISGLLFLLIASPYFFQVTNMLTESFGLSIANHHGCPNMGGLILHAILFLLIVRLLMR